MSLNKETYNKIAKDWHNDHQDDDWWISGTNMFASFLQAGDNILDVGCGAGTKAKYLAQKGFRVTGIDFSGNMIEIAKEEVPEAEFHVLDLSEADTLHNVYDGIFAQAVFLHIPKRNMEKKIKKLAEKLKNGGYFYVAVKEQKPGGVEEEVLYEEEYGYPYERFFSYFTLNEIKQYFNNTRFTILHEDVCQSGKTKWIQVIAQKQ